MEDQLIMSLPQASVVNASRSLQASSPGYGYVILSLPQSAQFEPIGEHFIVSYLPEDLDTKDIDSLTLCLWLGPGSLSFR